MEDVHDCSHSGDGESLLQKLEGKTGCLPYMPFKSRAYHSCPHGWMLPRPLKALSLLPHAQAAQAIRRATEPLPGHATLQPHVPNGSLRCAATFS